MTTRATPKSEEAVLLTALFRSREEAERAYQSLRNKGYSAEEINVMMSDATRDKYYREGDSELGTKALEGAGAGGAIGGTIGAIVAGIAAIGTNVLIPGLGLVIAGPLAAAIAGAGAGGFAGGLIGALIGWGIPEKRAKLYEEGIREGGTVLGVRPRTSEDAEYFEEEWKRPDYRGEHIYR